MSDTRRLRVTLDMPLVCGGGYPAYTTGLMLEVVDALTLALQDCKVDNWRALASLRAAEVTESAAYSATARP